MTDDVRLFVIRALRLPIYGESVYVMSDRLREAAKIITSLSEHLEQVEMERDGLNILLAQAQAMLETRTKERDAAIRDIAEAAPCFACIRFERNGGDCIGAHVCIDDILQDALGGKYADHYWQWRGVDVEVSE